MVALTLGLIIVGGVISIFVTNQQAFRTTEGLGRLQENARVSFELMSREIRQTGSNACGTRLISNVLNSNDWSTNWGGGTLIGYDQATVATMSPFGTATAERVVGTDALFVLGDSLSIGPSIASHAPAASPPSITLNGTNGALAAGTIVIICDSNSAAIAQVSSVVGTDTIAFNTTGTAPGNCTTNFGPGGCASPTTKTFAPNGVVSPLSAGLWYVGSNARGGRSLYRRGRLTVDEVAEGVVNMQIQYLFSNVATGTPATSWVDADSLTNWSTAAPNQVIALRFRITLQTINRVGTDQNVLERTVVYVVNLRNRLQ
jgi:type IV pilus assembly protein PilW